MGPFSEEGCISHLFATETLTSANTALMPSSPAAFWLRNQQKQLSHVGSAKSVGSGPSRVSPASASSVCPSRPLFSKHERKGRDHGGNARIARLGRSTAGPVGGIRFRISQRGLPVITDAASRAALRDSASCPSEIATARIKQHSGVRVFETISPTPLSSR